MNVKYKNLDGKWIPIWSIHQMNQDRYWDEIESIHPSMNDGGKIKSFSSVQNNALKIDDIKEFQLVYFRNDWIDHPLFPNLRTEQSIPYVIDVASPHQQSSLEEKGIIFRYERFGDITGKILYEGHLYAVTIDDEWIDVGLSEYTKTVHDLPLYFPYNEKKRIWISAKLKNLNIYPIFSYGYEGFHLYQFGWNRVFSLEDLLMSKNDEKTAVQETNHLSPEDRIMQPSTKRSAKYYPVALIGVGRSLVSDDSMYGATGRFFHTLEKVMVEQKAIPFNVQLFHVNSPYIQYQIPKEVSYHGKTILSKFDKIKY